MAAPRPFRPVKLVIGVLSVRPDAHPRLLALLEEAFGPIELVTEAVPFDYTEYYDKEMGAHPDRFFIICKNLVDPAMLSQFKLRSNAIEEEFMESGNRRINLDPGILSAESLILATTKNRSHRIPLNNGIYGEITLMYRDKAFQSFPWTYADYASITFKSLFSRLRSSYLVQLKQ